MRALTRIFIGLQALHMKMWDIKEIRFLFETQLKTKNFYGEKYSLAF